MRTYRQLTSGERYALSALRKQGCSQAQIARTLNRHPSTISREIRRNSKDRTGSSLPAYPGRRLRPLASITIST